MHKHAQHMYTYRSKNAIINMYTHTHTHTHTCTSTIYPHTHSLRPAIRQSLPINEWLTVNIQRRHLFHQSQIILDCPLFMILPNLPAQMIKPLPEFNKMMCTTFNISRGQLVTISVCTAHRSWCPPLGQPSPMSWCWEVGHHRLQVTHFRPHILAHHLWLG